MAHILIIEDDLTLQKVYSEILKKHGYTVSTANTGPEGMRQFSQTNVDLLLLDIMLPGGMNGFDILQQLKRDNKLKHLPVIVLTNLDSEKQTAMDYGAVDYFFKAHMDVSTLIDKVKTHIPSLK
jgi:DNA-binding response OmpR family regulator